MHWTINQNSDQKIINQLSNELSVDTTLAALLVNRGIVSFDDAKNFFRPKLEHLHNPFLMMDMDIAVKRIDQAISNKENILVYGDYDVDGATSTALLGNYYSRLNQKFEIYIPDRKKEGYGPSIKGFQELIDKKVKIIFTVDCGTLSFEAINFAKENLNTSYKDLTKKIIFEEKDLLKEK